MIRRVMIAILAISAILLSLFIDNAASANNANAGDDTGVSIAYFSDDSVGPTPFHLINKQ